MGDEEHATHCPSLTAPGRQLSPSPPAVQMTVNGEPSEAPFERATTAVQTGAAFIARSFRIDVPAPIARRNDDGWPWSHLLDEHI